MHINYLDVKEKLQQEKFKQDLNGMLLYTHSIRKIKNEMFDNTNYCQKFGRKRVFKIAV